MDILAITETWLISDIHDSFLSVQGYEIVRTDTVGNFRKHGVCFYIKNNISFVSVEINCPNVHAVHLVSLNCFVVVVYRPPSNSPLDNTVIINF